jgi:Transposase
MIAAYRHPDPAAGRERMVKLIESLSAGVPRPLVEIAKLGRTLSKRAADVLAYFDRPGTSNGPTEAINGHLEHLRGSALRFRNFTNYIARSLLETGGFRPRLHPALRTSSYPNAIRDPQEFRGMPRGRRTSTWTRHLDRRLCEPDSSALTRRIAAGIT